MFSSRTLISMVAAATILVAAGWWMVRDVPPPSNSVKLIFDAEIEGSPLIFDEYSYENPGGDGEFRIRNFQFFVSNMKLHEGDSTFVEVDSYHLVRFDDPDTSFVVQLDNIPLNAIDRVTFSIGVDGLANKSIETRGELDPNSRMAWNWEVGYKFVVFEGSINLGNEVLPLVYHVGFSENRRDVEFQLPTNVSLSSAANIRFSVDAMKLFESSTKIDMATLQTVKFDKSDAALLANNYKHMIALTGN